MSSPSLPPSFHQVSLGAPRLRRPIWWRRIHWRLMASYVLLAAFVIFTIWFFLRSAMDRSFEERGLNALLRETEVAAISLSYASSDPQNSSQFDTLAKDFANLAPQRHVLVVSPEGKFIGDSNKSERHHCLFEKMKGTSGDVFLELDKSSGEIFAVAFTETTLKSGESVWVYFETPTKILRPSSGAVWAVFSFAGAVAVMIAGILGFIASRFFTRPLTEMGGAALRMAEGDFSNHINYPVADELGLLGDSLDHLSKELSEKLGMLTEEKTRLATILSSMTEGVIVVNIDREVVLINPAVAKIFAVEDEETIGKPLEDVLHSPELLRAFSRTQRKRKASKDEFVLQRGQHRLDVMVSSAPIEEEGRLLGVVAVLNDISQLRQLERVRRDFVANVSHELRTPLTAIRGYTETLVDADMGLPDVAVDFLNTILRHTIRLSRLIDDLLKLASIEGRGLDSRLGPVDALEVIRDVIDLLKKLADDKNIKVNTHFPEEMAPVRAEVRVLRHILTNLFENALKYTPSGGEMNVSVWCEDGVSFIQIQDTGVGIAPQHLPRIFERFYRVDEGRSRDVGGSGLGLALVKHLISSLGADIEVDSTFGEGTTFLLSFSVA